MMRNLSTIPAELSTGKLPLYFYDLELSYAAVLGGILCLLLSWKVVSRNFGAPKGRGLPIVDQGQWWDVFNLQPKFTFYLDGRRGIENAYHKACGKPFRMLGVGALVTILPPEYADEIRNDKNLDFSKVVSKVGSPFWQFPSELASNSNLVEQSADVHINSLYHRTCLALKASEAD